MTHRNLSNVQLKHKLLETRYKTGFPHVVTRVPYILGSADDKFKHDLFGLTSGFISLTTEDHFSTHSKECGGCCAITEMSADIRRELQASPHSHITIPHTWHIRRLSTPISAKHSRFHMSLSLAHIISHTQGICLSHTQNIRVSDCIMMPSIAPSLVSNLSPDKENAGEKRTLRKFPLYSSLFIADQAG